MAEKVVRWQDAGAISQLSASRGIQRKSEPSGGYAASPALATQLDASKGGGAPLPESARHPMEQALGFDFSSVRIHTDAGAARMSQSIQAKAFTHGSDIYFNQGGYAPENREGQRLLAHELVHTVQQGSGISRDIIQRGGDEKKGSDPAKETPVKTEVEVVMEHDITEGKTKGKGTTTRSSEQTVAPGVTAKASEKTTDAGTSGTTEIKAKDAKSGLFASGGIKAESPADPAKADAAKGFIKVGGQWKLFDSQLQLGASSGLEFDFKKTPKWSADGKAVFFPNGVLTPEIAVGLVLDDKGVTGKIEPSMAIKITETLSIKAGLPITLTPDRKINVTGGAGVVFSF